MVVGLDLDTHDGHDIVKESCCLLAYSLKFSVFLRPYSDPDHDLIEAVSSRGSEQPLKPWTQLAPALKRP
ncbi:hypothetical protein TNCV_3218451 [Trichonephila clavipes]|nr:hypothetical protein TNCV_3218451 [Trichonephila clavipes]